jgi:hypothetical protein
MRISRRFRYVIALGCLKLLAATVLFVYGKHKVADRPARVSASVQAPGARPPAGGKAIPPQ